MKTYVVASEARRAWARGATEAEAKARCRKCSGRAPWRVFTVEQPVGTLPLPYVDGMGRLMVAREAVVTEQV